MSARRNAVLAAAQFTLADPSAPEPDGQPLPSGRATPPAPDPLESRGLREVSDGHDAAAPDHVAARREYCSRRIRESVFGGNLFADPSWDILLELIMAEGEGRAVTIKSACIAASAPFTTALRHIDQLIQAGLVVRSRHPTDRRSSFLELTAASRELARRYFRLARRAELRSLAGRPRICRQNRLAGTKQPSRRA